MHVRVPARFSASRILIARKRDARDRREENGDAERLVNVTQIFTAISPCLPTCFLRRLQNGARVRGDVVFLGALYRRSFVASCILFVSAVAVDRIKAAVSSCAFLQWQYLSWNTRK